MSPTPPSLESLRAIEPQARASRLDMHADTVHRLAFGLIRERLAAEDFVQETSRSAMRHLDESDGRSPVGTLPYRMASNASLPRLRSAGESEQ